MDNFKIIYSILKILEKNMDVEEFDNNKLSASALNLSEPKWSRIMAILIQEGYVIGISTWNAMDCSYPRVALVRPEITLKGLEYLEENTTMKKIANVAKGIIDIVPGM